MTDKPNIVYILADDMGYGDVSCLNSKSKIRTPFLDRMAEQGMVFRDAHASSAVCTPSRYNLLTGRYNWRSRLKQGVTLGYSPPIIEPGRMTVASFLRQQGYVTSCFGKWHLGWNWGRLSEKEDDVDYTRPITMGPTSVGFDFFYGISASLDMPPYVYIEQNRPTAIPNDVTPGSRGKRFWREGPIASDFQHETVLPELTSRSIAFIERQAKAGRPFFLYYPMPAPHTPILPTPAFLNKSETNAYGDFCLQLDDDVGQIADALERCGLSDNTILIFASDNGCSPTADLPELSALGHDPSYVFRGYKADIYEGGHRIPLIVRWPRMIAPGSICDETVCLGDLLATCAAINGVDLPEDAGEDSVSNLDLWQGKSPKSPLREATVHHSFDGSFSIRMGRWKLEMCPGSGGWSSPKPGDECKGLPPVQLYDLQTDIGERENLSAKKPECVAMLQALLTRYVRNGRSTPGKPQPNTGSPFWPQLWWMR